MRMPRVDPVPSTRVETDSEILLNSYRTVYSSSLFKKAALALQNSLCISLMIFARFFKSSL